MRYTFIHAHRLDWPITIQCRVLQVSTAGYYDWTKRSGSRRVEEDNRLAPIIRDIFEEHEGNYGVPRITKELRFTGHCVTRKRVARLMNEMGLKAKQGAKFKAPATTQVDPDSPVFPDLIKRDFSADEPNTRWVGDITYLDTSEGWEFLATVIDLYSRRVVGWALGDTIDASLVIAALKMAVEQRRPAPGVIFHSDRGCQYTSQAFRTTCTSLDVQQSMGRTGCCYDNAVAESFFHSLKVEWIHGHEVRDRQEMRSVVFSYIEGYYNNRRRHSSLGYLSPADFERHHHGESSEKMASRHHALPRSAAKRAPDLQEPGPHEVCPAGPGHHRTAAIRPPAGRSVPTPLGCLPPAGTERS